MRLTRPELGYREGGRRSNIQIRGKRVRRLPDVLTRPLKSCGFLGGAEAPGLVVANRDDAGGWNSRP